jgi:hypothetical protein
MLSTAVVLALAVTALPASGLADTPSERLRLDLQSRREAIDIDVLRSRRDRETFQRTQQRLRGQDRQAVEGRKAPTVTTPRRGAPCRPTYDGNSYMRACR